jgi:enoyl-CoA hydratase/carnithine racemase
MTVRFERDGARMLVTLDRPDRGNALRPSDMAALADGLDEQREAGARVAVFCGAGDRVFCGGYDLSELGAARAEGDQPAAWADRFPELVDAVAALRRWEGATIAAVNGHAIGGGALMATLCDLRVGQAGARFQIPASRIGVLYPLEGIRALIATIGRGRALEVLLLGDAVGADDGRAWGLYNRVEEPGAVVDRALELADALVARAPLALAGLSAMSRAVVDGWDERSVAELHAEWTGRCVRSEDLVEGIAAARERRPPRFVGR